VQCDIGEGKMARRRLQKEKWLLIGSSITHLGLFITPPSEIWR